MAVLRRGRVRLRAQARLEQTGEAGERPLVGARARPLLGVRGVFGAVGTVGAERRRGAAYTHGWLVHGRLGRAGGLGLGLLDAPRTRRRRTLVAGARAYDVRVTRSATAGRPARAAPPRHSGLPQRHEQRRQRHEPPPRPWPRASRRTAVHAWLHAHGSNTSGSNPPRPPWCRSRTAVQARGAPRATRRSNRRQRTLAGGGAGAAFFARSAVVPCCATCAALAARLTCIDCLGLAGALGTTTTARALAVLGLGLGLLRAAGADFLGFATGLGASVFAGAPTKVLGRLVR